MATNQNYDELLYPILHHQGNIVGFLDSIFDFLFRRTDFFKVKQDKESKLGLQLGEAESLVRTSFCKFFQKANRSLPVLNKANAPNSQIRASERKIETPPDAKSNTKSASKEVKVSSEKTDTQNKEERVYQSDPECYNGARYDNYSWAQTIKDLDVQVKVPKNVVRSAQVRVNLKQQYLSVDTMEDNEWQMVIGGDLSWKISVEDSAWTLVPGEHIHISLEKTEERWWNSLLEVEPKIDVQKIDASQNFEDLDEESRAKIQELMYNEHQKRLGKPTIEQAKMTEVLRDAWNRENSPFCGKPFDPSIVNFSGSLN